ncbi:MAG: protein-export membrane protein SecD [Rhizobiales bacterium 62-17]|nr:protein translocase subunit SecD [Hyphomicrobiales bacterium]OJY05924.1 MAG: protein-export membrane protein SecD [Rhizobiales bacterium 62-17]
MLRFSRWKVASVILLTVLTFLIIAPSFLTKETRDEYAKHLPKWVPFQSVVLGLDLQGGAHVVFEVDSNDILRTQLENLRDDVRRILREERVRSLAGTVAVSGRTIQLRINDAAERARVLTKLRQQAQPGGVNALGLATPAIFDVRDNSDGQIVLSMTEAGTQERIRRAVDQTIEVIRRRVDFGGTTEPNIQRQGADRVLVQVPGLQDTKRLIDLLGAQAKLEFRLVADPGYNPADVDMLNEVERSADGTERVTATYPVEKRVMVQGEDLTDAQPGFDTRNGEPVVNFRFNIRGGQRFGEVTSQNVGKPFAIVLDNKVISAPRILTAITGGSGQISGRFTVQQANDLAILLRAGALPAKLTVVEERTVGPGLGQDSIDAGKRAAYVAAALVIFYMLMTYGLFGVFANLALTIHIGMIFAGLILLQATLTLPGIAGIVLTIGMAVDANVLIYERIREEAKSGRSIISALDAGFNRAFATIIDSNSTMMVAAVILYFLGSGPVRGFAVSLGLGIITSVVTAVTMTRMMIALWYRWKRPTTIPI